MTVVPLLSSRRVLVLIVCVLVILLPFINNLEVLYPVYFSHILKDESKDKCDWYNKQQWWSEFNVSHVGKNELHDPFSYISAAYNFSIPMQFPTVNIKTNPRCKYQGKIFNIGIQKTGSTSMLDALKQFGYHCLKRVKMNFSTIAMSTCYYSLLPQYPNKHTFLTHRYGLWRPFAADDISFAFANRDYRDDLFRISRISQVFDDSPWCFLYPLWDKWYPNSKYIYTVRASTYDRVNSVIKHELRIKRRLKWNKLKAVHFNMNMTDVRWNSELEHLLADHNQLLEMAMLNARLYEKHHSNVLRYFGDERIGIDKDVLILCLECEHEPWQKIGAFLDCEQVPNGTSFPHRMQAELHELPKYYIPKNMSLHWRKWNFSTAPMDVFNLLYNDTMDEIHKFYGISKLLWGWDVEKQSPIKRL